MENIFIFYILGNIATTIRLKKEIKEMGRRAKNYTEDQTRINKQDFVKGLADALGTSTSVAKNIYEAFVNYLVEAVVANDEVVLSPLGIFKHKLQKGKKYRTMEGGVGYSPNKTVISFTPFKDMRVLDTETIDEKTYVANVVDKAAWANQEPPKLKKRYVEED